MTETSDLTLLCRSQPVCPLSGPTQESPLLSSSSTQCVKHLHRCCRTSKGCHCCNTPLLFLFHRRLKNYGSKTLFWENQRCDLCRHHNEPSGPKETAELYFWNRNEEKPAANRNSCSGPGTISWFNAWGFAGNNFQWRILIPATWAAFSDVLTPSCSSAQTGFVSVLEGLSTRARKSFSHWEYPWMSFPVVLYSGSSSETQHFSTRANFLKALFLCGFFYGVA